MAKKRNWTQISLLLLFLVGFPLGSYLFLKSGYDFRVESMKELKEYGSLSYPSGPAIDGKIAGKENLKNKVVLLHHIDLANEEQRSLMGKNIRKIHGQFDGIDEVVFLAGFHQGDSVAIQAYLNTYQLTDREQYFPYDAEYLGHDFDFLNDEVTAEPYVILSDTTGTIRNFYNLKNGQEFVRLVEHITYLMPAQKKEKAIIKPEQDL